MLVIDKTNDNGLNGCRGSGSLVCSRVSKSPVRRGYESLSCCGAVGCWSVRASAVRWDIERLKRVQNGLARCC